MRSETTNFLDLQRRLLAEIRSRIRNGDLTERSLARMSGISQPHIHNVLKGTRYLSTVMADQILATMRMDLADLISTDTGEWHRGPPSQDYRRVPLLSGRLGDGEPFPQDTAKETYIFASGALQGTEDPAAVILGNDSSGIDIYRGRYGVVGPFRTTPARSRRWRILGSGPGKQQRNSVCAAGVGQSIHAQPRLRTRSAALAPHLL